MIDNECGEVGGMRIGRGNRNTRRKPAPVPLCPPQIPHDLTRHRTRVAAATNRLSYGTDVPDPWLDVKAYQEDPETGHLDTDFLFPPVLKQILKWFTSPKLLLHAFHNALPINFIKMKPVGMEASRFPSQIIQFEFNGNSKFSALYTVPHKTCYLR
jgi:hypothetical protein